MNKENPPINPNAPPQKFENVSMGSRVGPNDTSTDSVRFAMLRAIEAFGEVCWHCHDIIEPRPALCETCPEECSEADCEAPGCADTREQMGSNPVGGTLADEILELIEGWRKASTPKESGPVGNLLDAIETHCRLANSPPTADSGNYMLQARAGKKAMPRLVLDALQVHFNDVNAVYPMGTFDTREKLGEYLAAHDDAVATEDREILASLDAIGRGAPHGSEKALV